MYVPLAEVLAVDVSCSWCCGTWICVAKGKAEECSAAMCVMCSKIGLCVNVRLSFRLGFSSIALYCEILSQFS